jgi:hypothetical protein
MVWDGHTVEEPCHQHFHDQEYDDSSDIVLHSQDIMSMLHIEECPEYCKQSIRNRQASIKGELGNLGTAQFSISVPELDNSLVFHAVRSICANTVVASLFDEVICCWGIVYVYGAGLDLGDGSFSGIGGDDVLANLGAVAELVLDILLVADIFFLWYILATSH